MSIPLILVSTYVYCVQIWERLASVLRDLEVWIRRVQNSREGGADQETRNVMEITPLSNRRRINSGSRQGSHCVPVLAPMIAPASEEKITTGFKRDYLGVGSSCGQPGVLGTGRVDSY